MTHSHVQLIPYSPGWPKEFQAIAADLRSRLGTLALRIDHIGSTAVSGLASKDVIDIQVTVASLDPPEPLLTPLTSAGYQYRRNTVAVDHRPPGAGGPDSDWQKLFLWNTPTQRRCNIHIRALHRPNQCYPLLVRDFLRGHPRSAEAYSRLKHLIAPLVAAPVYPDIKDPACDLIYEHAMAWAASIAWEPTVSDG